MKTNREIITVMYLLLSALSLSGCSRPQGRVYVVPPSESAKQSPVVDQGQVAKRFQEPASQGRTAVESAIELSQKYAELSEEAAGLRREKQDLTAKNRQLKEQISVLEADLKQTQKELTEANDLLIEMRIELNNWKTDILGFRGEMREAETAQLEALLKILKILGGEVTTGGLSEETAQPESKNTLSRGEPNE